MSLFSTSYCLYFLKDSPPVEVILSLVFSTMLRDWLMNNIRAAALIWLVLTAIKLKRSHFHVFVSTSGGIFLTPEQNSIKDAIVCSDKLIIHSIPERRLKEIGNLESRSAFDTVWSFSTSESALRCSNKTQCCGAMSGFKQYLLMVLLKRNLGVITN